MAAPVTAFTVTGDVAGPPVETAASLRMLPSITQTDSDLATGKSVTGTAGKIAPKFGDKADLITTSDSGGALPASSLRVVWRADGMSLAGSARSDCAGVVQP